MNKTMKLRTALKWAREGRFEFVWDVKIDRHNEVRYQTPTGKWKTGIIFIVGNEARVK